MRVPHIGTFHFSGDEISVWREPEAVAGPYILGKVFGIWLELTGWPVLHGCCLAHEQGAFGLLGMSGMGKSTLGAALNSAGFPMVTDDLIPLVQESDQTTVYPGLPFSRMWPDTATRFIGPEFTQYPRVLPAMEKRLIPDKVNGRKRFTDEPQPLKALFLLNRTESEPIRLRKLNPSSALIGLLKTSFQPEPVEVLGLQAARMDKLAKALSHVEVIELTYPSGYHQLPEVRKAIQNMLGT